MGALVGALFTRNTNKTKYKQRVSRGYDSESGTTIHKASLKSGAFFFSGYGRFLVVATRYLFAGFHAISANVLCCQRHPYSLISL